MRLQVEEGRWRMEVGKGGGVVGARLLTHLAMLFFLWTSEAMASASSAVMEAFLFMASASTTASCHVLCQLKQRNIEYLHHSILNNLVQCYVRIGFC